MRIRLASVGIGAMPLLAGIVLSSAMLRLSGETGQLLAQELGRLTQAEAQSADQDGVERSDEVSVVLDGLAEREARLDARESELEARSGKLDAAADRIAGQLERIEAAEAELRELLKLAGEAAEADLQKLASVYETMRPEQAAALFQEMPANFAAGFMGLMRTDAAAAVLAGLPPDKAYSISVMLAGRHADLP